MKGERKMIYTSSFLEIEDHIDQLVETILCSKQAKQYISYAQQMESSAIVQEKAAAFIKAKEDFEKIESYGKYAPDFNEKRRVLRAAKRNLDVDEIVAQYRFFETAFQDILDRTSYAVAQNVSKEIKVDAGNPFFEFAKKGCGGNCHVG